MVYHFINVYMLISKRLVKMKDPLMSTLEYSVTKQVKHKHDNATTPTKV